MLHPRSLHPLRLLLPLTQLLCILALTAILAILAACNSGINGAGSFDTTAKQEVTACPMPRSGQLTAPPSGIYIDHGIRIDYARLAPGQNPLDADQSYVLYILNTPAALEQLYFDATRGNNIAAWSACVSEVSARYSGRAAARKLASLGCKTVYNCRYDFDRLPFSPHTASGARILTSIARAFDAEATRLRIRDDLISHALSLHVGVKIAGVVRPGIPASVAGASAAAAGPAQGFHSFRAFKRAMGPAGPNMHWHHIVEQHPSNVARFGPEAIHNTRNVIAIDARIHQEINAHYSRVHPFTDGKVLRKWLSTQSFEAQYQYGLQVLHQFGITP